jgi:hypothetical protein
LAIRVHRAQLVHLDRKAQQDLWAHRVQPETADPLVSPASQVQQATRDRRALQAPLVNRETKVYLVPLDSMAPRAQPVRTA